MNAIDYALSSTERLRGLLLDRQAGKVVPQVLIDNELRLLTERVRAMGRIEPVVFDLTTYRNREADETPVGADGVAEDA